MQIVFDLQNAASLGSLAPDNPGGGGYDNATLPAFLNGSGIYVIANTSERNRYVGVSNDLYSRFKPRMATITEFGFTRQYMSSVSLYCGYVHIYENNYWETLNDYRPPFTKNLNGVCINLEKLLIRYFMVVIGDGWTVSNNLMIQSPIYNSTNANINVRLVSGPGAGFQPYDGSRIWQPGEGW